MVVEYDGTAYRGWQRQRNGVSIQEILEDKISLITGKSVKVTGSGRTDAGVHAFHQVASFRTDSALPCPQLVRGLNSLLPSDIAIKTMEDVSPGFHARKDVKAKTYLYRIYNGSTPCVFLRRYTWHIVKALDLDAMKKAAVSLIGTHDFKSFTTVHTEAKSFVRTLERIEIYPQTHGLLHIEMEGDGFLRYMARVIVGTLVEVGRGKRSADDIPRILAARNRSEAGMTAPPQGLFLKEVRY